MGLDWMGRERRGENKRYLPTYVKRNRKTDISTFLVMLLFCLPFNNPCPA